MILWMLACAGPDGAATFEGGDYEVATVAMVDDCLDGALEALFMPQGRDTPQVFEFPVYVPGQDELPLTYDISLREPFVGVEITLDGDSVLEGETSTIDAVLLNEPLYGDCGADMSGQVTLTADSSTSGTGSIDLELSNFQGAEERCPTLDQDPCPVSLDIVLNRI